MTTLADNLIAARKLIEKPENWASHEIGNGHDKFCARAAIAHIARGNFAAEYTAVNLFKSANAIQDTSIANFNDTHTHSEVIAAFDRAIEQARKP